MYNSIVRDHHKNQRENGPTLTQIGHRVTTWTRATTECCQNHGGVIVNPPKQVQTKTKRNETKNWRDWTTTKAEETPRKLYELSTGNKI